MTTTAAQKRFGKNVQYYRKEAGLTQEQLGELTDLDCGYISGVERDVRNAAITNNEKIAKRKRYRKATRSQTYIDR